MATRHFSLLLRQIRHLAGAPDEDDGDSRLLERFLAGHDEAAFTALVRRHGPMVFALCRRMLRNEHDAEDAFQATFVVLARKAASVRHRHALGGFLHEVAYHIALRVRANAARRQERERQVDAMRPIDSSMEAARRELRPLLDEELRQLPEKYRQPLILCYLEGKTSEEAARQLGWPIGSMSRRLARGRELLRRRLIRRGVTLPAGLLATALAEETAAALVPPMLVAATARMAVMGGMATDVPASVMVLVQGRMREMLLSKLRMTLVLVFAAVGVSGGALAYSTTARKPAGEPPAEAAKPADQPATGAKQARTDLYGDPLPPGALIRLGTARLRHRSPVVAFAAGGKTLISVGDDKTVRRWQTATGKEVRRTRLQGAEPFTLPLALTADGKTVAGTQNESLRLWDAASGKELRRIAVGKVQVPRIVFSPDGKILAAVLYDLRKNDVHLWDVATGKEIARLPHDQFSTELVFSPDGKLLATIGPNSGFRLWDVGTGKELRKIPGWRCLAFSPDGKKIAAGNDVGLVKIWDVASGRETAAFGESIPQPVFSLTFAPDGTTLAVALQEKVVLWDVAARKRLRAIAARSRRCVFAPDGKMLATSTMSAIHLWDVATGREIGQRPGHDGDVDRLAVSPDGRVLASSSWSDRAVRLWNTTSGKPLAVTAGHRYDSHTCIFSADGKFVASGGSGAPCFWDAHNGKEIRKFTIGATTPLDELIQVPALALSPSGDRLAALSFKGDSWGDYQIDVWNAATGKHLMRRACPPDFRARFAPDGESIALHARPGLILQDTATGRELLKISGNVRAPLAFSPDGQILAVTSFKPKVLPPGQVGPAGGDPNEADAVCLIERATGKQLLRIETGPLGLNLLGYSPDGRLLATADGDHFRIWDAVTGKRLFQRALPEKHHGSIGYSFATSLAFLPGGDRLATGLMDSTILIWDLEPKTWRAGMAIKDLDHRDLERLWSDLAAEDASKAHRAVWTLAAVPAKAVPFLKNNLRPASAMDAKQIQRLLADLDSDQFAVRDAAGKKLAALGEQAEPALRQALAGKPSLEARKRLEALHADAQLAGRGIVRSPAVLRTLRGIRTLEHIGSHEARQVLQILAAGDPAARSTCEAKVSVRRLVSQSRMP